MKLIIIGNGFDLASGLPTKYRDFFEDLSLKNNSNFTEIDNFINNEISKNLKQNEEFNPSMLYFSLLAVWFKELNKESKSILPE